MITTETQFNRRKLLLQLWDLLELVYQLVALKSQRNSILMLSHLLINTEDILMPTNSEQAKQIQRNTKTSSLQKDGLLILTDRFETSTKSVECHSVHSVKKYSTSDASKHGECESTTTDFLYPNFLSNTLTRIRNTLASLVSSKTD